VASLDDDLPEVWSVNSVAISDTHQPDDVRS